MIVISPQVHHIEHLFDFTVSNPPYQRAVENQSSAVSIYPHFINYGTKVSNVALFVHPIRSFVAGSITDGKLVKKLVDSHTVKVADFYKNSKDVFPSVDIKGGVVITYSSTDTYLRNDLCDLHNTQDTELLQMRDVIASAQYKSVNTRIVLATNNVFTEDTQHKIQSHRTNLSTNIFAAHPELFHAEKKRDDDIMVLGRINNKRQQLYISSASINVSPQWNYYKVALPKANGGKYDGGIGKTIVLQPEDITTATFIAFSYFDTEQEAKNFEKYINSKVARALLSIKKITQDNSRAVWEFVPDLLEYTDNSHIDWEAPLDNQLIELFGFTDSHAAWIEDNICDIR